MNSQIRRQWFRHYWWITAVLLAVSVLAVLQSGTGESLTLIATLTGVALTVIYFVQKQKLEEIQLFEKLFTQFNKRYEELNDKLEDILAGQVKSDLEVRKTLNDYFNLCAEEYLFYSEGRIHQVVWKAWCEGMQHFLKDDRIRQHWNQEIQSNSYYGLKEEEINKGAAS